MGADSDIAWCDDTLNVWEGCEKTSPGCKHCYAEHETPVRVHRARGLELWGPKAARYETKGWEANLRSYVREAQRTGKRRRVFAQSLSDTFEAYRGGRVLLADGSVADILDGLRARFFEAIDRLDDGQRGTSSWAPSPVDMLLLTKRIENVLGMVPAHWREPGCWPSFVWVGATVEDREQAAKRIPHLRQIPGAVRFLSVEPLLEDLGEIDLTGIHWVIVGGESGTGARPFDLAWARSIKAQCAKQGAAFFVKQGGAAPFDSGSCAGRHGGAPCDWSNLSLRLHLRDKHGGNLLELPEDLRVREFPRLAA